MQSVEGQESVEMLLETHHRYGAGALTPLIVLVCFPPTQVMTPHQVVPLPQQIHSRLVRTQGWSWAGLRSVTLQKAVYTIPFASTCHSCPVEPAVSFAIIVLSCMFSLYVLLSAILYIRTSVHVRT